MIKVSFLPAAEIELLKEVIYYSKGATGAGLRFQAAVEAAVSRVRTHPLGDARRLRAPAHPALRRFISALS